MQITKRIIAVTITLFIIGPPAARRISIRMIYGDNNTSYYCT
jgi:hypothetical protein